jgi:hypothetical protein
MESIALDDLSDLVGVISTIARKALQVLSMLLSLSEESLGAGSPVANLAATVGKLASQN